MHPDDRLAAVAAAAAVVAEVSTLVVVADIRLGNAISNSRLP